MSRETPNGSRDSGKLPSFKRSRFRKKKEMPGGLWVMCPDCKNVQYKKEVEGLHKVCPECNFHFELGAPERITKHLDPGSFEEMFADLESLDPLEFKAKTSYRDRLAAAKKKTGLQEACVVGRGLIENKPLIFGVTDPRFMRGSMGSVVGEKIALAAEAAAAERLPFVFVSGSGGGARMDEGILSLMQMAKTSAALAKLHEAGMPFISVLTHPTMGGAMASFAALGDVMIAEPKALLGFAGPGVVKNTIKAELPKGFQTSEFLLEHGMIDMIVNRQDLRGRLSQLLSYLCKGTAA